MTGNCAPYRGADEGEGDEEERVQHHVGGGRSWGDFKATQWKKKWKKGGFKGV